MKMWSRQRRQAARVDVAVLVTALRVQLANMHVLYRSAAITEAAEDKRRVGQALMPCMDSLSSMLETAQRLPWRERLLVARWEYSAYRRWGGAVDVVSGDLEAWVVHEESAAELIAMLPDGLDEDAATAIIAGIDHRIERENCSLRGTTSSVRVSGAVELREIDQRELVRLLRRDLSGLRIDATFGRSGRIGDAIARFDPWLCAAMDELKSPCSAVRSVELIEQWRQLRREFLWKHVEREDPTQVVVTGFRHGSRSWWRR